MKTFALEDGDFVVGAGGFEMVAGASKVIQDLSLALRESYGTDRFHPGWGSLLSQFIGYPISDHARMLIRGEVTRVIRNYIAVQTQRMEGDSAGGRTLQHTTRQVIVDIPTIEVRQEADTFHFKVGIVLLSGERFDFVQSVEI